MSFKSKDYRFAKYLALALAVALLIYQWKLGSLQSPSPRRQPSSPVFELKKVKSAATNGTTELLSAPSVHFITYGDQIFDQSKKRVAQEAAETGWFVTATSFGPENLPASFVKDYEDILSMPRGGGYWIWKYAIWEQALAEINEGDFLVYLDAGCSINPQGRVRFDEYLRMVSQSPYDIISMENRFPEHHWTTERIFSYFNVSKEDEIRTKRQYLGSVLVARKGAHLRRWLRMVWDALEADAWMFTDKYNEEAKRMDPEFQENRHDQSVSSVSRKIVGSVVIADEANAPYEEEHPFWTTRKRI